MLLQRNIVKKYLSLLDEELITKVWEKYSSYFLNEDIQANIHKIKEEQFQEGFLRELFVKVLGYTINPSPNYNLTTELKNEVGSKKADGAILIDDKVVGVIELKDHKTPDLASIENQAFGYKSKHKDTRLVIISNFEKLRFYIDNAVEYREWDIFHMTKDEFRELYLCLAWTQVERGIALQMKEESVSTEDQITNALYKDYSQFKRVLFADIVKNNPAPEGRDVKDWQLLLFKKTQKLLDRLLFIFFAEDCGLLPPNSIVQIIDQWEKLKEMDEYRPFYDRMKKYFGYMNTGFQGKKYEIFAYNGGLFKPDEVLDSIKISDDLLAEHSRRLSEYDFESDVDVNILGHIFENSLSEIEEVTQQIQASEAPLSMGEGLGVRLSKRKQDGVFYTPQYITKYIVENTVGRLCDEKKKELNIIEDEYFSDQRRQMQTKKRLMDQLQQYRKWLLEITILDPACGSGAFLNAALQFLIAEHKHIDEMEAKVTGSTIEFQGVENAILENNLYGVDINEESVGIAQLALWLRTAKPHRKLNSLNENIKCGNSLISDPAVAGDKAFNWQEQFPKVFEKGGFDVVIGNPPYVRIQGIKSSQEKESHYYEENYLSAKGRYDLYILFIEQALNLINGDGLASYILPHNFMTGNLGAGIRELLSNKHYVEEIVHFGSYLVFEEALTYTCVIKLSKDNDVIRFASINPKDLNQDIPFENINYNSIGKDKWNLTSSSVKNVLDKVNTVQHHVSDFFSNVGRGIVTGMDDCFIMSGSISGGIFLGYSKALKEQVQIEADLMKPILMGNSVHAYSELDTELYVLYPHIIKDGRTEVMKEELLESSYPLTYSYLSNFKETLVAKKIKYKTNPKYWYSLHNSRDMSLFVEKKIITPYLANICQMSMDCNGGMFTNDKCSVLKLKPEYEGLYLPYLAILNSRLCWFFISNTSSEFAGGYFVFSNLFLNPFPIPDLSSVEYNDVNVSLSELASLMLSLNSQLQDKRSQFLRNVSNNFEGVKITTALQQFDQMDFAGFMKELKKQKITIPLKQQDEWEEFFNERVAECQKLSGQIKATDEEIDNKVFDLYGLTEEERRIVMET